MRKLLAALAAALCSAYLTLPAFAIAGGLTPAGLGPVGAFAWQFVLVMALVFIALLLTKRIAAWIDNKRGNRKD